MSTALRFVRTHNLIDLLAEDVLFVPVMCAFNDGQPQHAYNLGEGEPELQLKMISYAIRKGHRLAAGRLVDRFGLPEEGIRMKYIWGAHVRRLFLLACLQEKGAEVSSRGISCFWRQSRPSNSYRTTISISVTGKVPGASMPDHSQPRKEPFGTLEQCSP